MLLILGEFLFNLCFYSFAVYLALLFMERIGKKRRATWKSRIVLAGVMAAGATIIQLIVHAVTLIYSAGFK